MKFEVYKVLKTKLKSIQIFDSMKEATSYVTEHNNPKVRAGEYGDLGIRTVKDEDSV